MSWGDVKENPRISSFYGRLQQGEAAPQNDWNEAADFFLQWARENGALSHSHATAPVSGYSSIGTSAVPFHSSNTLQQVHIIHLL